MKLDEETRKQLEKLSLDRDNEDFHALFDRVVFKRLRELDIELWEELQELRAGLEFWYA